MHFIVLALGLVVATSHAALAQGPVSSSQNLSARALKDLSLEELANIEVTTAAKLPEPLWQTAAAMYVITQDDIRRSGATTIPDVLRLAPGVIVSQSDANRWAVGVRGFADIFSKSVLVLIDGRNVYTPLVGGVHWAIQDVVLGDIERIEIIRGPGGSVWGANAENGVINIITRSAADTTGVRLLATTGNVEHGRIALRYGAETDAGVAYRGYVKGVRRDAQFHADGSNFDEWNALQGGARADWSRGRDTFMMSGDVYRTNVGERAGVAFFTPPRTETIDGSIQLTGGNALFHWDRAFAGGAMSRVQAYYDRTGRDGFTFSETRDTFDVDGSVKLAPWGRHVLTAGAGARVSPSVVTQLVPTLNFAPNEHTHALYTGFVQDDVTLVPGRLDVTVGAKVEHNSYTGAEVLPSARLLWRPNDRQAVWTSIARAVRTPSRFERDLEFEVLLSPAGPVFAAIEGSPTFQSETMIGIEGGYRQLVRPTLYVDVAAFRNRYSGLAGFADPIPGAAVAPIPRLRFVIPFVNGVDARTAGLEVSPSWRVAPWWELKGSYSYLRITADNRPGISSTAARDNYVGLAPRHQVRLQSHVDAGSRVELGGIYRYVAGLLGGAVPAYHAVDARVGWRLSNTVELSAVGQNLFDAHHPELNAVPVEIRRSVYVQLVFQR